MEESPAVVQPGDGEVQAAPEPVTHAMVVAQINASIDQQMAAKDREYRLRIARRGYRVEVTCDDPSHPSFGKTRTVRTQLDPSIEPTDDELRAMVPLPEDRRRWATTINGEECTPRIAYNKHGIYSTTPKPKGRMRPHMSPAKQAVHCASLRIYKKLFLEAAASAEVAAAAEGKDYVGVPEADVKKMANKAIKLGAREVFRSRKAAARYERRVQAASRKVNAGLLNGNQVNAFINRGGR